MDDRLPWFRTLSAAHRSWVTIVAQAGISGFVDWLKAGSTPALDGFRITGGVFGSAPRELLRTVSLRRTVELVRIAIGVAEQQFPALVEDPVERAAVADSLLRYSREVAFSAAAIYAAAAETRGAWDDRLEAMVVDAIVRGEAGDAVESRAAALNWDVSLPVTVLVGAPGEAAAGTDRRTALTGVHGDRYIVVLADEDPELLQKVADEVADAWFGPGPVVRGPVGTGLRGAIDSARQALSGLRAVNAWPAAPRGVTADDLLPERVLAGDAEAAATLRDKVFGPLVAAGGSLIATLDAYAAAGGALEPAARELFVHTNTVRYRLHRVTEVTGLDPWRPRDGAALRFALALGRLRAH
ncbi:PucR family transcriptional regulator [Nakamurella sp. YIM 132087]|uniref:PucR family transcriptional regulator n=2 Tax=Nakamurella alba TaxID=2665158 RepID=A0A7K1FHJ2_9ACTN|nr:PucR family transcriptional regulator [Nakamurella alba]